MANTLPPQHEDPAVDLLRPYIAQTVRALESAGVEVEQSWLDPSGPRDATIVYRVVNERHALVWDEEAGWRSGKFRAGRPGQRTQLVNAVYLGGGLTPAPEEVSNRLTRGASEAFRKYRDHATEVEHFNARLEAYDLANA
jgi:Family of unknown function (DUF6292)